MASSDYEGPLYFEKEKVWEEVYGAISGNKFQAFKKIRADLPASKSNRSGTHIVVEVFMHFSLTSSIIFLPYHSST